MQNLIICTTPLQMMIADKIIELKPDESFDLLVIAQQDNEKYEYYFNQIKKNCINSMYYPLRQGIRGFSEFLLRIYLKKLNKNYDSVYLSSIDSSYCKFILSRNKSSKVFTFDDGTANISESSTYYTEKSTRLAKRLAYSIFNINESMGSIKDRSLLHYTIYKNIPNIIEDTYYINLFESQKNNSTNSTKNLKEVNIFLGQPYGEVPSSYSEESLVKLLEEKLYINLYFPHPRETSPPTGKYKLVRTNLIFEDYIRSYLKDHENVQINVFTFISSAILNLEGYNRVETNYIYDPLLYDAHKAFYSMVKKYFNIPLIHID